MEKYFQSDEFLAREKRRSEIIQELIAGGTPFLTAAVIAGDIQSAEIATERVNNGEDPMVAYKQIGSYARFEWCVKNLPQGKLLKLLPELWIGADPNDSDPAYLNLWKQAFANNGHKTIFDNKRSKLPKGAIQVYRGQIGEQLGGISWTTDLEIAKRFALTGGGRQPVSGGVVFKAQVNRKHVLAFLTKRSESELIIDTKNLTNWHISHRVEEKK